MFSPRIRHSPELTRVSQAWPWLPGTCLLGGKYGRTQRRSAVARRARKVRHDMAKWRAGVLRHGIHAGRTWFSPDWERTADERKVCLALEKVAGEVGAKSITAGAFAWSPRCRQS